METNDFITGIWRFERTGSHFYRGVQHLNEHPFHVLAYTLLSPRLPSLFFKKQILGNIRYSFPIMLPLFQLFSCQLITYIHSTTII